MKDSYGREINYLRVSVTQRCNFRCAYCGAADPDARELSPGQFEIGRVISPEGNVEGSEGKYMYAYSELRYVQNRTLYFVSEYYQEGTIRMSTGNLFAVDVYDGHLYQAIAGSNNTYTLRDF